MTRPSWVTPGAWLSLIELDKAVRPARYSAGGCDRRAKRGERSYPTSEVRGSGREYQTAKAQERQRGPTPRPRSGGVAERRYPASEVGAATREVTPRPRSGAAARRRYPTPLSPRPGAAGGRSYPTPPRPRPGAAGGATQRPRSCGCAGTGGPRRAIEHRRSGRAAVRRYPSSKIRSNGCALLEQR